MVMLYELKKWLGVYYIQFKNRIQDILVAFKLKRIQQRIQQDASCMKKLYPLDKTNLLHALKQDTPAHIQQYLETPEGQIMKAETLIRLSEEYLMQLANSLLAPDLKLNQKMLLSLAIQECSRVIQVNEQILNSMTQSKSNEIF